MTSPDMLRFKTDKKYRAALAEALNVFAELCAEGAEANGFHDDEKILRDQLQGDPNLLEWSESQLLQAEFGRIISECGEGIDAVRENLQDDHLPEYPGWAVELADTIIRVGDTTGKRIDNFGEIVVAKMLYNLNRPHKHGKNS